LPEQLPIALIAGLGNPGPAYEQTRHNAGFWFADEVARRHGGALRPDPKFQAEVTRLSVDGRDCWLLKPMTFMNRSGQSVGAFAAYYRIPPEAILVVHDELDLPPGTVRLKRGGGHGGHNGLRDITSRLGSSDFSRLRIGIGHPGSAAQVVEYVLHRPSREDEESIREAVKVSADTLPLVLAGELEKAMNRLHSRANVERP
jgi:peptidyl-tRNA hydrolase, PTH1 family